MTKTTTARTTTGTDQDRDEACSAEGADLVELRLDTVLDLALDGALAARICPVIVTWDAVRGVACGDGARGARGAGRRRLGARTGAV